MSHNSCFRDHIIVNSNKLFGYKYKLSIDEKFYLTFGQLVLFDGDSTFPWKKVCQKKSSYRAKCSLLTCTFHTKFCCPENYLCKSIKKLIFLLWEKKIKFLSLIKMLCIVSSSLFIGIIIIIFIKMKQLTFKKDATSMSWTHIAIITNYISIFPTWI